MSIKEEIEQLPDKFKPLSPWAYFGYFILYHIPFIGFIILIINALSGNNINKRNFARSYFCIFIIVAIVLIAGYVLGVFTIILDEIQAML